MEIVVRRHNRIDLLDAIRGVAILSMVVYHALYDVYDIFGFHLVLFQWLEWLVPPFAGAFILLSGVSCRFSHSNFKRGARILMIALLVTLVTVVFMPSQSIYFGILHFMGCAILLFALLKKIIDRIPPFIALPIWTLLFVITYSVPLRYAVGLPGIFSVKIPASVAMIPYLFPFGLPDFSFFSADYYPLIPWLFLFLAGTVIGIPIYNRKLPKKFYTARVPVLASAGRNTLLIYVLHQPIIYPLLYLIFKIINR